jgi:uncharacterized protein YndB with AHSA1/START domain
VTSQTKPVDQNSVNEATFTKTMHIHASPHRLYEAVSTASGVRGWWVANTVANDGEITVRFGGGNFQTLRLMDLDPDKNVVWEWIDQYFPVEGTPQTDEWVGTRVSFEIQAIPDGLSTLVFTHLGLTPQLVCYGICEPGWNFYLASLKRYLEEGTGAPYTGPV